MIDSSMKKTAADSKTTGNMDHTPPARLIAVRERMLEFYLVSTTQFSKTLVLDVIQFLKVGSIFNLNKVNTVPCMCAAALIFSLFRTASITAGYSSIYRKHYNTLLMI